jgi:hypothetical protein
LKRKKAILTSSLKTERKSLELLIAQVTKQQDDVSSSATGGGTRYWQVVETSTRETMKVFLRLFLPRSGLLSKNKTEMWPVIQRDILAPGYLTHAHYDSCVETAKQRLRIAIEEVSADNQSEDILDMSDDENDYDEAVI